ncbi:Transforming acidic coiled-coil-containing protein [Neofusicoccum parvum]|nr:Transforming acidic coiled-coil-containing protein [Neofusicoccum parvum]
MSHVLQSSAGASGGGIDVSRMQGSLQDRIILVTHSLGQLKSQVTAQNALLAEKDVLLAERKDLLNERKIQLLELKQENKGLKDELRDVKDQLRIVNDQLRGANEDRRILQMQNVILQRDVQVQMNNIHLIMQGKEPVSDDKPEKKEASQNAPGAPATKQRTPASKMSTPQRAQTSTPADLDVTPTPTKATLARTNMSFTSPSKESMMSTALVPTSPSRNTTTTSASTPRSISKTKSTTFTPGLPSTSPLIAHGSNPILRERASYQTGRSEDPFQNTVSRQPSMMSLNSQSSSSNENLRTTYPKNTRPTSKALASSNWRLPQQQQRNPVPEPASLEDIRNSFAQLLAKIEIWADFYTGTMHTSVRAKEPKTADMVKTLGSLLGNFDMEKVFNKLETRTLLVTSWINRTVLCILFDDNLPEKFLTGDMLARFKELSVLESSTPAHDPARHRDLLTEKAEIVRAAVSAEVPGGWRDAESRKMAAEVCGLLSPIVPTGERAGGCREMAELVGEAVHVACAMRCLPARAWHLAFDVAGARVNTSSMSIRGPIVQGRGEGAGAAVAAAAAAGASLEEEHAVVLGVTPHLVSKLWTPGGVAPEELLKAEVLVAAVGRGFFMHH